MRHVPHSEETSFLTRTVQTFHSNDITVVILKGKDFFRRPVKYSFILAIVIDQQAQTPLGLLPFLYGCDNGIQPERRSEY